MPLVHRKNALHGTAKSRYRSKPETKELERLYRSRPDVRARVLAISREWHRNNLPRRLLNGAKQRALRFGLEFSITIEDISVPELCPVLGVELKIGPTPGSRLGASYSSPTLDRIDPALGYIPGNVCVISMRANNVKRNATLAELEAVVKYMKRGALRH